MEVLATDDIEAWFLKLGIRQDAFGSGSEKRVSPALLLWLQYLVLRNKIIFFSVSTNSVFYSNSTANYVQIKIDIKYRYCINNSGRNKHTQRAKVSVPVPVPIIEFLKASTNLIIMLFDCLCSPYIHEHGSVEGARTGLQNKIC
jgi:hypothetical protein